MRQAINGQSEFDFQPSNLKLTNQYYAKFEAISKLLDANPQIIKAIHEDLKTPLKYSEAEGKDGRPHRITSDQVLRVVLCQIIEGASLREIVIRIDDSNFLRRFVRIYNGPMMDFTTLDKLKNSVSPETWSRVNQLLAKYAVKNDLITGEKLRLDTTAVETNIHWPRDSGLLWDTYRVVARLIEQAREVDPDAVGDKRLHCRRAKKLHTQISRKAGKGKSADALKPLYGDLLERVESISDWAGTVRQKLLKGVARQQYGFMNDAMATALAEELEHFVNLGAKVIDQARRRVLEEQKVPNSQKLFSIFEPHTELLIRGKAGKDVEFGHMIQIQQVGQKFITDYEAFENKPVEHQLITPALKSHRKLFGAFPDEVAADKGYYESREALEKLRSKVDVVAIGKKGSRTPEETELEHDPVFRHAQRFRAGVEGTISFLKRVLRLARCFNKGWDHFAATIGATVLSHNLLILSRG